MNNQNKFNLNQFVNNYVTDKNTYHQTETNRSNWDIALFQIDMSKIDGNKNNNTNLIKKTKKSSSNNKTPINYEVDQSKIQKTEQSNREKLGIIKRIKLNKSSKPNSRVSIEKYNDKNLSSRLHSRVNNEIHKSTDSKLNISERSRVLNGYLNEKFKQKLLSKKWYNNYKPDSNDNSLLEEKNNVNIYIESDKSLFINKQKKILFDKSKVLSSHLKRIFSSIENENIHDKSNLAKRFYYQTKYSDVIKRFKEKQIED